MYWIVLILLSGVAVGYVLRHCKLVRFSASLLQLCVYLLLFIMGLSIGAQEALLSRLPQLGLTALILSLGGILGSCLLALWIYRMTRQKSSDET